MSDLKSVMDAAETALNVIVSASNAANKIPGVELIPYVGTVAKYISYGKKAIEVGKAIEPDITDFINSFTEGLPSEEKRAALDARIVSNHAEIQSFNPVAEEGEDD